MLKDVTNEMFAQQGLQEKGNNFEHWDRSRFDTEKIKRLYRGTGRETVYRIVISESGKEEKRALQCRCDEAMELVEDLGQYHRLLISDLVGGREIRIHLTGLAYNPNNISG